MWRGCREWVGDLGADVVIDYRTQDFETVVHDDDVVVDSQGRDTLAKSLRVLKPGGIAIGIAGPPDSDLARRQGLRLPLRLVMALLSLRTRRAARRRGVRYAFLFIARQRCPARRDHQTHRYRRPAPHRRPGLPVRRGPAGPGPRRRRPRQGQGRHRDALRHASFASTPSRSEPRARPPSARKPSGSEPKAPA